MADSGGHTGTPVIPVTPYDPYVEPLYQDLVVPLWRYAQMIEQDECALWGITYEGQPSQAGCDDIWTEQKRRTVQEALYQAQVMIEELVGFFLKPTYVWGLLDDAVYQEQRFIDQQQLSHSYGFHTRYKHLLEFGKGTLATLQSGASVSHITDPSVIGPLSVTIGSIDEVKVYHPGSNREIKPSSMTYSGGNLIIFIPRCRLVKESLLSQADALQYVDTTNFVTTVDVKRLYTDTTDNGNLVKPHTCSSGSLCFCRCNEFTQAACGYLKDRVTGNIDFVPALYSDGSWTSPSSRYCAYPFARLYYKSGLRSVTSLIEHAVVRLAHTIMPYQPCSCSVLEDYWRDDRKIPNRLTRAREFCPLGQMDGAWWTFRQMQRIKITRGLTL